MAVWSEHAHTCRRSSSDCAFDTVSTQRIRARSPRQAFSEHGSLSRHKHKPVHDRRIKRPYASAARASGCWTQYRWQGGSGYTTDDQVCTLPPSLSVRVEGAAFTAGPAWFIYGGLHMLIIKISVGHGRSTRLRYALIAWTPPPTPRQVGQCPRLCQKVSPV